MREETVVAGTATGAGTVEATATGDRSPEQLRAFFDAYGFVVLRGLFADEVDELSQAFDDIYADPANPRLELSVVGHRWGPRHAMADFVEKHPRLQPLMTDPRLLGAVRTLLGPEACYSSSDAAIYWCETEWHFDSPEEPAVTHLKCALYLEPLTHDTGALRVLPASHHDPSRYRGAMAPFLGFDGAIEGRTGVRGEDLPCWTLESQPGDVIAWDFHLMHSSYGSTDPRRKFALNFRATPPQGEPPKAVWRSTPERPTGESRAATAAAPR